MNTKDETNLKKAQQYYDANSYYKAERSLAKIKTVNLTVTMLMAEVYYALKKYALCIVKSKTIVEGNPIDLASKTAEQKQLTQKKYLLLLAKALFESKAMREAKYYLEQSVALDSTITNAEAIVLLLIVYKHQAELLALEALAPKLLSWEKYHLAASVALIQSAAKQANKGLLSERLLAIIPYACHLKLTDVTTVIYYLIASGLYEQAHNLISAYKETHKQVVFSRFEAQLLLEQKKYQELLEFIRTLPNELLQQQIKLNYYYAKALDSDKKYSSAFEYLTTGAKARKAQHKAELTSIDYARLYRKQLDKKQHIKLNDKESMNANTESLPTTLTHVFAIGFPRSGTTLLDNILNTQPNVFVASEPPSIACVIDAFSFELNKKYPQDLTSLTPAECAILRRVYFNSLKNMGYEIIKDGVLVDKNPHHTIHLPLINVLFPYAKIILSVRHPLDVCLSCFQADFVLNKESQHLISIKDIVTRYVSIFTLLRRYQSELNNSFLKVRYEDLVTDFETQVARVFNFIGIEGDDKYKDFHQHDENKFITSASRGQTNQPLYKSSLAKWRNYEVQLQPYKPQLQTFIDEFGYSID